MVGGSRDIEATAVRLDEAVERRHRVLPDGTTVTWRSVAVDTAGANRGGVPSWPGTTPIPTRPAPALHPNGATGFARLDVVTPDMTAALQWLGGRRPPGVVLRVGAGTGGHGTVPVLPRR
jgi:hypothetical protein